MPQRQRITIALLTTNSITACIFISASKVSHLKYKTGTVTPRPKTEYITLFNTQNVMETRLAKLHYFEAAEFENDIEIFSLALVFELQLWPEISLFSIIY